MKKKALAKAGDVKSKGRMTTILATCTLDRIRPLEESPLKMARSDHGIVLNSPHGQEFSVNTDSP